MITRLYQPHLKTLGISYPQYLVMLLLWEKDQQSVKSIGTRLFLNSNTLTPLLKRLEQQGLVLRRRASNDERRVDILLTQAGRALAAEAQDIPHKVAACMGLEAQEFIALREQLWKFLGVLDEKSKT